MYKYLSINHVLHPQSYGSLLRELQG